MSVNNNDEPKKQKFNFGYIIFSCICFIFCVIVIMSLVNWYWKAKVVSQALSSGRPDLAAVALSNNSGYRSGYGRHYGYNSTPLISIGRTGWGRPGRGIFGRSGRGSSGRSGRGRR